MHYPTRLPFLLIVLLAGIGPAAYGQTTPSVLAHWSQIVGNASSGDVMPLQLMARFIVNGDGQNCTAFALTPQAQDGSPSSPGAATTRALPSDSAFPITVCQFEMGADWTAATLHAAGSSDVLATFPGAYSVGRRNSGEIVAIGLGDTGCRASDCDASGGTNTRFQHVITEVLATTTTPDLVLHVGDYRYYNENTDPDAWSKWLMEFFRPAQPLLNIAPVALSRGNHEGCDGIKGYWYGTRWFQFFEPTTSDHVASCDPQTASLQDTWFFDIALKTPSSGYGRTASLPHRLVMIDDSPDPDNFSNFGPAQDGMTEQFEAALALPDTVDTWWLMHKPVFSYPNSYASVETQTAFFGALGSKTLCTSGDCHPRALMAGHAHMYQQVDFHDDPWPIQYVLGHSGVRPLSGTDLDHAHYEFQPTNGESYPGYATLIYSQNGFLIWRRSSQSVGTESGWTTENCLLNTACQSVSATVITD